MKFNLPQTSVCAAVCAYS